MADLSMPQDLIDWMNDRNWGPHHAEWHFVRRWDFWHALAPNFEWVQEMVDEAVAAGWKRADLQEGQPGAGLDFLAMHRAMFQLLYKAFPQHVHYLRGWTTPPTDPADSDDPVESGEAFEPDFVTAISELENPSTAQFPDDDSWGLFLETNLRPTAEDPTGRSDDPRVGIHNYMHNRWSDPDSAVNLGDPSVNIFNQRFWRLHCWIDFQWWRFRLANGASETEEQYQELIQSYRTMMDHRMPHSHAEEPSAAAAAVSATSPFRRFFAPPR